MIDASYVSERIDNIKQEISDLRVTTAVHWNKSQHAALEKSAYALKKGRLREIKRELSGLMKRRA
jgi:hypothetical protein